MGSLVREETKAQKGTLLLGKKPSKAYPKDKLYFVECDIFFLLWLENIERKNLLKYTEKKTASKQNRQNFNNKSRNC